MHTQLSIMHSVWLRLVLALPFVLIIFLLKPKLIAAGASLKVYGAITGGVIFQTIIASYLWFYCTYKIGISSFQILIATLPFFVYAADVYFFKRTKPSLYFLVIALIAVLGIWLVMG
jgi:drug/metabolite transporter (DMT)-like permease